MNRYCISIGGTKVTNQYSLNMEAHVSNGIITGLDVGKTAFLLYSKGKNNNESRQTNIGGSINFKSNSQNETGFYFYPLHLPPVFSQLKIFQNNRLEGIILT